MNDTLYSWMDGLSSVRSNGAVKKLDTLIQLDTCFSDKLRCVEAWFDNVDDDVIPQGVHMLEDLSAYMNNNPEEVISYLRKEAYVGVNADSYPVDVLFHLGFDFESHPEAMTLGFGNSFFPEACLEPFLEQEFDFSPYPDAVKNIITPNKYGDDVDIVSFSKHLKETGFKFNENPDVVKEFCRYVHDEGFNSIVSNFSSGENGFDLSGYDGAPLDYLKLHIDGARLDHVVSISKRAKAGISNTFAGTTGSVFEPSGPNT